MVFLIGLVIVFSSSYISLLLLQMKEVQDILAPLPFPAEFVVTSSVYLVSFLIYYFVVAGNKGIYREIAKINDFIQQYVREQNPTFPIVKTSILIQTTNFLQDLIKKMKEEEENLTKKLNSCKTEVEVVDEIFNLEGAMVVKVNQDGKVIKANKRFLKFFAFENEVKLNMSLKNLKDIFDDELPHTWLNDFLGREQEVSIKKIKFVLSVEKAISKPEYVLTFINITEFEQEKRKLIYEREYVNENLKTTFALNKSFEITIIRVLNYENYATHLGTGIMELFQEEFAKKIKSLGVDEVFRVQDDIYAIYGNHKNSFNKFKKVLEETVIVELGEDKYIFNPRVVFGAGVNFEQAKQQIYESTHTLISKFREEPKFSPEIIKLVVKSILEEKISLAYSPIANQPNTLFIKPVIKDDYSNTLIDDKIVLGIAHELNLYLMMIKIVFLNNIVLLKDQKIIVDLTSTDLLATTLLNDLLILIRREELNVVFNININSNYSAVAPIIKSLKSVVQVGIRKVGKGYLNFRDVYALKVEFLEVDDSVIQLIKQNPQWKFLIDSVKILLKGQRSKILAKNYSDEKVFMITDKYKLYEG